MQSIDISASPERRSAADLQRILDSLIGDAGFVLSRNLPSVLLAYEQEHDLVILDTHDHEGLQLLCSQHDDLELGPQDVFNFLTMIPKPQRVRSPSPTPGLPHSASLPPASFRQLQEKTPKPKQHNRRHSDRVKSPSDSSSSSSDENQHDDSEPHRAHRLGSAPPGGSKPFPASSIAQNPLGARPLPPKRNKTLSDPSRNETPLPARLRGNGPPSAFGNFGGGFARPSPASRRRRGSASGHSATGDDDLRSPDYISMSGQFPRAASVGATSPPWTGGSSPASPISPTHGIDHSSFHERAKSPSVAGSELDLAERNMEVDVEEDMMGEEEADRVEADVTGQGMMGDLARLSRISTESATSLRTSHDKLRLLQKQNGELARKLKDSEKQLTVLGAENERLVEDLQEKLEEARAEITQRRKDEKEMKSKERTLLIQIAGFEADIQSLQRSLENSKANHASMQKMYNSQCDEAQRLRDLLLDRDAEIKQLEEAAQTHGEDEEKFDREVKALEAEIKRLESDLSVARQAESVLEVQKQENLQLKETIDRMRFDLDEARAAAANGSGGHIRGVTAGSSNGGTMSRNLGDELNRRLMDAEMQLPRQEEDDGESVVETIVTTQRRRKIGRTTSPGGGGGGGSGSGVAAGPTVRIEEGIREYADASTETDPVPAHEHPPAYTAEPQPVDAKEVLDRAHPKTRGHGEDVEEEYETLVEGLGMRCTVLEEELEAKRGEAKRLAGAIPPGHARTFSEQRKARVRPGIVNYIYYNTPDALRDQVAKVSVWAVAAFAVGIIAGSHMFTSAGMHPRDYQLFTQMNSLAGAAGAGEGFLPLGQRGVLGFVDAGARMVAGRVPS